MHIHTFQMQASPIGESKELADVGNVTPTSPTTPSKAGSQGTSISLYFASEI